MLLSTTYPAWFKILLTLLTILFVLCLASWVILRYVVRPGFMEIRQRTRLKSIDTALELFKSEFDHYPPSDAMDEAGVDYCGAMKLYEAVMGQDRMGFHRNSVFRSDGTDGEGNVLYPKVPIPSIEDYRANLEMRKGPYIPYDVYTNACTLSELYGDGNTESFEPKHFVLCDAFKRVKHSRANVSIGMPILYYKADTSKTAHDVNDPDNPENIYDYKDNHALLALGVPGKPGQKHPLYEDPKIFYEMTWDDRANGPSRPYRAGTFILLSAGHDGLYGTKDDIVNFEFRWKRE